MKLPDVHTTVSKQTVQARFHEELGRGALMAARAAAIGVLVALVLAVPADLSNLEPRFVWEGMALRALSIAFFVWQLVATILRPQFLQRHYQTLVPIMMLMVCLPAGLIPALCADRGTFYFLAVVQVEFGAATFFTIKKRAFVVSVALCNLAYLIPLAFYGGQAMKPDALVNVLVVLLIFAVVAVVAHKVIYDNKFDAFSQREALEISNRRTSDILESITDAFMAIDTDWNLTFLNRTAERFFARDDRAEADLIGRSIWELYPNLVEDSLFYDGCRRAMQSREPVRFEEFYPRLDGYFQVHAYPSRTGLSISAHETTARRRAEERLRESLVEKEILLKHIHHGVKNNLQIVSSLLSLQAGSADVGDGVQAALQASMGRIQAIALVHEKLYESADLTNIDFQSFADSMARNLFSAYGLDNNNVRFVVQTNAISLPVDTAIPCALIVNELLANALQHAFQGIAEPAVTVQIRELEPNVLLLVVEDNGRGFSAEHAEGPSLGLKLVRLIAEKQLRGQLTWQTVGGARFTVRFPVGPSASQ